MRYGISKGSADDDRLPSADPAVGKSVQFGDTSFHMFEDSQWAALAKSARKHGSTLKRLPHQTSPSRLHMVVQKGRLFQQEHPEVPVLLDKGRYLVVELDRRKAKQLDQGHVPCFSIRPLAGIDTAFNAPALRVRRGASLPWVQALVNRITRPPLEADLKQLIAFRDRFSTSVNYMAAAKLARTQLTSMGYQTRLQNIRVGGGASMNVIADRVGQGRVPRGVVILSAHLDSINLAGGPSAVAPGADDDGSGSAGVLAIARALKDHRAVHDLRLILFGGEEQGLFGSRQYVASLSPAQRKRIRAVVHMDMIGAVNATPAAVLLEGALLSQSVVEGLADAAATYSSLKVQTSLHPFNSDHVSFLNAAVPAVLTIEGTDDANSSIHSANDTLAHIDFSLAVEILKMNVAFVAQSLGQEP